MQTERERESIALENPYRKRELEQKSENRESRLGHKERIQPNQPTNVCLGAKTSSGPSGGPSCFSQNGNDQ